MAGARREIRSDARGVALLVMGGRFITNIGARSLLAERRGASQNAIRAVVGDRPATGYCALAVGGWSLICQCRVLLPLDLLRHHLASDLGEQPA
jgi:hypothetical protein